MLHDTESAVYEFDRFLIDSRKRSLWSGGKPVSLTPKVFDTLFYLVKNAGRTIGKDELMQAIWPDTVVEENNLNKSISALRQSLGEKPGEHRFIVTVPGKGYKFVASVVELSGSEVQDLKAASIEGKHLGLTLVQGTHSISTPTAAESNVSFDSARSNFPGTPELRPGLLSRFFLLFGKSPYQQWEIMQIRILIWCALIGILGWICASRVSTRWGYGLFLVESICIALLMVLASFLLYVGALQRERLEEAIRNTAPWIRMLVTSLVLISWAMAVFLFDSHIVLAAVLALCGTTGGLKYTLFKNQIDAAVLARSIDPFSLFS